MQGILRFARKNMLPHAGEPAGDGRKWREIKA